MKQCWLAPLALLLLSGCGEAGRSVTLPLSEIPSGHDTTAASVGSLHTTGSMTTGRAAHTATLLKDGTVLITGGFSTGALASAELFDPASGTFAPVGRMAAARQSHTATLLPDGRVLIAGGYNGDYLASTEIYEPATRTFMPGPLMTTARSGHTATVLDDRTILFAGGVGVGWSFLQSAELYHVRTKTFSATGSMSTARESHTATLLGNGTVLVAGGHKDRREAMTLYASAEVYDPATGRFRPAGGMGRKRHKHDALRLKDGRVLITGGADARDSRGVYDDAEIYDPAAAAFRSAGRMSSPRYKHNGTSVLFPDGSVLLAGGADGAELYRAESGIFTAIPGATGGKRLFSCATPLPDGRVLICGGYGTEMAASSGAWLYSPGGEPAAGGKRR